ncbi:hypothetical protein HOH51_01330 [bacterium]|jgi:hypothetical protein|nr:hypothetical protein [bacterium]
MSNRHTQSPLVQHLNDANINQEWAQHIYCDIKNSPEPIRADCPGNPEFCTLLQKNINQIKDDLAEAVCLELQSWHQGEESSNQLSADEYYLYIKNKTQLRLDLLVAISRLETPDSQKINFLVEFIELANFRINFIDLENLVDILNHNHYPNPNTLANTNQLINIKLILEDSHNLHKEVLLRNPVFININQASLQKLIEIAVHRYDTGEHIIKIADCICDSVGKLEGYIAILTSIKHSYKSAQLDTFFQLFIKLQKAGDHLGFIAEVLASKQSRAIGKYLKLYEKLSLEQLKGLRDFVQNSSFYDRMKFEATCLVAPPPNPSNL